MPLSPKDPTEIINIGFDFAALTATPSAPTVSVELVKGTDATPSAMLSGSPSIVGSSVYQKIIGGVDGCTYNIRCTASAPDGSKYVLADVLHVFHF